VTAAALLLHGAVIPVGVSFPAGLSLLFFFSLLPVCLSQFPSRYSPVFLCFSVSVVSLSTQSVSLSRFPSSFFKNTSSSPSLSSFSFSFLSCTPSVFIGRGSKGHPALPSHGRVWWQHGGGYCTAAPASAFCMVWPFWREGVVVSVKGQVGALVFWVLGERERIKNGRENASSSPVLCVSRGRRRLMVPFKTAPFASSFFSFFFFWQ